MTELYILPSKDHKVMKYCPINVTIQDVWIDGGISKCFLETITSSVLGSFLLIFGTIQLICYLKCATKIQDLPFNNLYGLQLLVHIVLIVNSGVDFLVPRLIFQQEVFGYEVLSFVVSLLMWAMALMIVVMERNYRLPNCCRNRHGLILIITWIGCFAKENLVWLSNEKFWDGFEDDDNKIQFSFWIVRYLFKFVVLVLGIRAPGIKQSQGLGHEALNNDEEASRDSHTQGSTWSNLSTKFTKLLPFIWPKKSIGLQIRVIFCFMLTVGGRVLNVVVPIYSKHIVDQLTQQVFCWDLILIFVGLKFLQESGGLTFLRRVLWIRIDQYLEKEAQITLFGHMHSLSLRWHLSRKFGEVLQVMDRGIGSITVFLNYFVFTILPMCADIVIALVYFSYHFNHWFGLIVFVMVIVYSAVTIIVTELQTKYRRDMIDKNNDKQAKAVDSLVNFETVKYFNAEEHEMKRYKQGISDYQTSDWKLRFAFQMLNLGESFITNAGYLAGALLAAYMVSNGTKTVGDYVFFGTYLAQVTDPIYMLATSYRRIQNTLVDLEKMLDLLDEPLEIKDPETALELKPSSGKIEFKEVSFAYNPERPILKNISFTINPGETIGIVGPTGSGKSTLMRLLFRLFDVQKGSILFDDQDIRTVTQHSLRKEIGVVPQDTVLFNNSIENNIKYAKPEASHDEVRIAASMADIHDQIMTFPEGFETVVGERGLKLSGGEKQRIAIARTLLKNPLVILLDEATSALDTATEKQIQAALNQVCCYKTTMIIAHRLSTITHADKILVLKQGEIVQQGTHKDLLEEENGLYKELWDQQSNAN